MRARILVFCICAAALFLPAIVWKYRIEQCSRHLLKTLSTTAAGVTRRTHHNPPVPGTFGGHFWTSVANVPPTFLDKTAADLTEADVHHLRKLLAATHAQSIETDWYRDLALAIDSSARDSALFSKIAGVLDQAVHRGDVETIRVVCVDSIAFGRDMALQGALVGHMLGVVLIKRSIVACTDPLTALDAVSRAQVRDQLITIRGAIPPMSHALRAEGVASQLIRFGNLVGSHRPIVDIDKLIADCRYCSHTWFEKFEAAQKWSDEIAYWDGLVAAFESTNREAALAVLKSEDARPDFRKYAAQHDDMRTAFDVLLKKLAN